MFLQIEDCTGILKALHPGIYFIFIFDHICGHDRGREDRLNVTKIISGYGGAQLQMHPTNVKQEIGFPGLHEKIIQVGGEQHVVFQEGGDVPFWMTP